MPPAFGHVVGQTGDRAESADIDAAGESSSRPGDDTDARCAGGDVINGRSQRVEHVEVDRVQYLEPVKAKIGAGTIDRDLDNGPAMLLCQAVMVTA